MKGLVNECMVKATASLRPPPRKTLQGTAAGVHLAQCRSPARRPARLPCPHERGSQAVSVRTEDDSVPTENLTLLPASGRVGVSNTCYLNRLCMGSKCTQSC